MAADHVTNWSLKLQGLLYEQFKGKPNFVALCNLLGRQADQVEAVLQQYLLIRSIDDNVGAQLDAIGRLVGQARAGADDVTYRLYLKARIAANKSKGTPEDLYAVFCAMLGSSAPGQFIYHNDALADVFAPFNAPASLTFQILPPITDPAAQVARVFLGDAKLAGVRAVLEWQEAADAQMFTFAYSDNVRIQTTPGDPSLEVNFAFMFPPLGGQLILDRGTLVEETVTYDKVLNGILISLVGTIGKVHAIGASVELVGDAGLGFGNSSDASVGGQLAGAMQA